MTFPGHLARLLCLGLWLTLASPAVAQQVPAGGPSAQHINRIGNAMIGATGTQDARILLYAEVNPPNLLFETRYLADGQTAIQRALPADDVLQQAIVDTWRVAHAQMGDNVWRVMIFQLDHGRVNMRFLFAGDYDPVVSFDDRYAAELGWFNAPPRTMPQVLPAQ
jgi:hypothetical protein